MIDAPLARDHVSPSTSAGEPSRREDRQLATIPPILPPSPRMKHLDFSALGWVAMPDVRERPELEKLDLRDNNIRTVPAGIRDLPAGLTIDLQDNPLSAATIDFLRQLSETGKGPRILFSRKSPESDTKASLASEIDFWLRSSLGTSPERPALQSRWRDFEDEPDADNFALLLNQLIDSADFQGSDATRHALLHRMSDMLATLAREDVLRARCFELAADGVGVCGDRVALAFNNIEMAMLASACGSDRSKLLNLARAEFRLAHLDEIARNDKKALKGGKDEVEVVLAYRCHLTKKLKLPCQPQEMLHAQVAQIGYDELKDAVRAVRSAEAMPGALATFTAALPFWRDALEKQPRFVEAIDARRAKFLKLHEALEQKHLAPDSSLTLGQYAERAAAINAAHAKALEALYEDVTADAIKKHSVPRA